MAEHGAQVLFVAVGEHEVGFVDDEEFEGGFEGDVGGGDVGDDAGGGGDDDVGGVGQKGPREGVRKRVEKWRKRVEKWRKMEKKWRKSGEKDAKMAQKWHEKRQGTIFLPFLITKKSTK